MAAFLSGVGFSLSWAPGLAVSVRRMSVCSRAVLSRANRSYVLCCAVVCRVSPYGVRFELLVAWEALWHVPSAMVFDRIII